MTSPHPRMTCAGVLPMRRWSGREHGFAAWRADHRRRYAPTGLFIPAMLISIQKWQSNIIFSIAVPFAQRRGSATTTAAHDYMQATNNLSWHLVQGCIGSGPSRQPLKGARGLSPLERRMALAQSFLAKQMRYARNRSQRMLSI